jgi:uncharacterized RDD family membrane protein YckC
MPTQSDERRVKGDCRPGLLRRLAAILYDSFLLLALAMLVTGALLLFTGGTAIAAGNPAYRVLLLALGFGFFTTFWVTDQRTLGMRAWGLRLERFDGGRPGWRDAFVRAVAAVGSWAILGLGFLWVLVDRERLAWHDRLSRTRLVITPRSAHAGERDGDDQAEDHDREPAHEGGRQLEHGAARGERARADEIREPDQHADHESLSRAGAAQRPEDER